VKQENVIFFSEKEEELVHLLFDMGIKRSVAKVLIFLARTPTVTSRMIEQGTDLRQSEVAMVIQSLRKEGWIRNQGNIAKSKGRPAKIYELAKSITEITNGIGLEGI
jgi:predicted transcriptional regulator